MIGERLTASRVRAWMLACAGVLLLASGAARPDENKKAGPALWNVSNSGELVAALEKIGPAGGTINLAPGTYALDKTIEVKDTNHLNLVGSGWNTVIQKRGDGDAFVFDNSGFCVVRNLLISGDSSAATGSGIVFKGAWKSSSCTVDFCRIANFPESGIRFEGDAVKPLSTNTVSNCHFIGNLGDQLYSRYNNDFYVRGNQFGTHGKHPRTGCVLDHSSAGTYTQNYHWGNRVAFKLGPQSHFNRIENNRFEESDKIGVMLGLPDDSAKSYLNIFTGNTVHTNSQGKSGEYPAVVGSNACDVTFCQNQVFSWDAQKHKHKSSLVVDDTCKNWIIKDNILKHNTGEALVYSEDAGHIVKDNILD